jgi:hypothetical protein
MCSMCESGLNRHLRRWCLNCVVALAYEERCWPIVAGVGKGPEFGPFTSPTSQALTYATRGEDKPLSE